MENLKTVTSLILDVTVAANNFEREYSSILANEYKTKQLSSLHTEFSVQLIDGPVLMENVLVPRWASEQDAEPYTYPLVAIHLIRDMVENFVNDRSAYIQGQTSSNYELLEKYLNPRWFANAGSIRDEVDRNRREMYVTDMFRHFSEITNQLDQFLGFDGWVMHFVQRRGRVIFIEKSIDYRIHDWNVRHDIESAKPSAYEELIKNSSIQ